MPIFTYKLDISVGGNSVSTGVFVQSVAETRALVAESLVPCSEVIVTHLKHGADHGNFVILLNPIGLACLRLLEHRGFYASRLHTTPMQQVVQLQTKGNRSKSTKTF
jgi:hypothetical protein